MKIAVRRSAARALAMALFIALISCVASVGYDEPGGDAYGVGSYDPPGYVYGGWSSSYHVAPPRGDHDRDHGRDHDRDSHAHPPAARSHASAPAYRAAPSSKSAPSIPSHHRPADSKRP